MEIYLDNSATTKISPAAARAVMNALENTYGNPSSLHSLGSAAMSELTAARACIAKSIGASVNDTDKEIIFTSGGTEANCLAVLGAARAVKRRGNKIVTTMIEHSSVLESCKQLEREGFEVVYLKSDKGGHISVDDISDAIDERTVLVSMMYVNNELGTILPVERVPAIIKRKKSPALFHIDAVQAYGKLPIKVKSIGCDMMTISAHKIHGPKGCGALYIKKGVHIQPLMFGGEQEKRIRPGTEAMPLICGFAAAANELPDLRVQHEKITKLRDHTLEKLMETDGVIVNSPPDALPFIINISTQCIRSETMIHKLAEKGIFISSGSACAKGKKSHVLTAAGLSDKLINTALRISFSSDSTEADADAVAAALKHAMSTLVRAYGQG